MTLSRFRACALSAALVLASGCAAGGDSDAALEHAWESLSVRARLAQLVVAELPAATASAAAELRAGVAAGELGGLRLSGGDAAELAALLDELHRSAPLPLLVVAGLDEGSGGAVAGATRFPPIPAVAALGEADELQRAGRLVGREARALRIGLAVVDAAPDTLASPGPRAEDDEGLAAYARGLREAGLLVALQPFEAPRPHAFLVAPAESSAAGVPLLPRDRAWLEVADLARLRAAREQVAVVVLPAVAIPALAGDTLPLPLAPRSGARMLRRELGFDGVVAVELGSSSHLARTYGPAEAAILALEHGADLLLGVDDPVALVDSLAAALEAGRLRQERIDDAGRRLLRMKAQLPAPTRAPTPSRLERELRRADAVELAAELASRHQQHASRANAPPLRRGPAAEAGMSEAALARADAVLRAAVAHGLFPGAALAVGRRGVLVRLSGYGQLTREPGAAEVDAAHTLFDIASLTKVVGTTALAMALRDDGVLDLDAPVHRYVEEWGENGNGERRRDRDRVTIRRLLAHTAGLPAGLAVHSGAASPEAALRRVIATPPTLDPGAVALYSDIGMILLAEALSRAGGEPFDQLLARRVLRPLGMESTMFLPPLALRGRIAPTAQPAPDEFVLQGIVHDGTAFRLGGVSGHAGLFSNAADLAVFAQTVLNGGAYGPRRVFSAATVGEFRVRQPQAGERALGWDTPAPESSAGSYFSAAAFGHTGFTGTSLWIDPEKELFVVLLTNRTYVGTSNLRMLQLRQRLHDAIARAIIDTPVPRRPGAVDVITPPRARPPAPPRRAPQARTRRTRRRPPRRRRRG